MNRLTIRILLGICALFSLLTAQDNLLTQTSFHLQSAGAPQQPHAVYEEVVKVTPGGKYLLTGEFQCNNPNRGTAFGAVICRDKNDRNIPSSLFQFYPWHRTNHNWRSVNYTMYVPDNAVKCRIYYIVSGKNTNLNGRKLHLKSLPISADPLLRERDRLLNTWYKPLPVIETLSTEVVTPHTPWFKPAPTPEPRVLYLPFVRADYSQTGRLVLEIAQRQKLNFTYLPLLSRVTYISGDGIMGVWGSTMVPGIEKYSLLQLARLSKSQFDVVLIQNFDFKRDGSVEFFQRLKPLLASRTGLLLVNCKNIPAEYRPGKPLPPTAWSCLPLVRQLPQNQTTQVLALYRRGTAWTGIFNDNYRLQQVNPLVPENFPRIRELTYSGWDYPVHEYFQLTLGKLLRICAQKELPVMVCAPSPSSELKFSCVAQRKITGSWSICFKNFHREQVGKLNIPVSLKPGKNIVDLPLPHLPGGSLIAEFQLLEQGKVLDAGAVILQRPEAVSAQLSISPEQRWIKCGEKVKISAQTNQKTAQMELSIRDTFNRVVFQKNVRYARSLTAEFSPEIPDANLYLVKLILRNAKGQIIGERFQEFALTGRQVDTRNLIGLIWPPHNSQLHSFYRQAGFDQSITFLGNLDAIRSLRMNDLDASIMQSGHIAWGNTWRTWKSDRPGPEVRQPCFSDPAAQQTARRNLRKFFQRIGHSHQYYDMRFHYFGDEQYLGLNTCFSPHCLKDFQRTMCPDFDLKKPETARLGGKHYIDHRIFMNRVWAEKYIGQLKKEFAQQLQRPFFCGLSGTDHPGCTYNWVMLMKKINYVSFYSGIQRKMIMDFGRSDKIAGRWGGNYTLPIRKDWYVDCFFWSDLFAGANQMPYYGKGFSGDYRPLPVFQRFAQNLREGKRGVAKLLLNAETQPQVAVIFSQRSQFAFGVKEPRTSPLLYALIGWDALLRDLAIPYRLVPLEEFNAQADYQLVILPHTVAMSDRELQEITKFAARKPVLADLTPAQFDEHGAPRAASCRQKLLHHCRVLPLPIHKYYNVELGGYGGETVKNTFGPAAICHQLRRQVSQLLRQAGIIPFAEAHDATGTRVFPEMVWKANGSNFVLGILNNNPGFPYNDSIQQSGSGPQLSATVKLAKSGYLYDVRARKYLGRGNTIKVDLAPGQAKVFTILPDKINGLKVDLPPQIRRGDALKFRFAVQCASGTPGQHTIYYELTAPDGTQYPYYAGTQSVPAGTGQMQYRTALNEQLGSWRLLVRDVNSGVEVTREFQVTKK